MYEKWLISGFKVLFLKGYDVDGAMSELVNYDRSPDNVSEGFSDTLSETAEISAKSTGTVLSTISLLKLFSKELSAPAHPGSIAMKKMQDIPEIRIIAARGTQKPKAEKTA